MSLSVDVEPRLAGDFAERIAEAVSTAVETALRNVLFGINLTDDERLAVEMYRAQRDANAIDQAINRRGAREAIRRSLHARDTDNH